MLTGIVTHVNSACKLLMFAMSAVSGVYALNASTGAQKWYRGFNGEWIGSPSPAVGHDGETIYVADFQVHALDAWTGVEKWAFDVGGSTIFSSTPAESHDGTTIFIGSIVDEQVLRNKVYALDTGIFVGETTSLYTQTTPPLTTT